MSSEHRDVENPGGLIWLLRNIWLRIYGLISKLIRRNKTLAALLGLLILYTLIVTRGSYQPLVLELRKYYLLGVFVLLLSGLFTRLWKNRNWKIRTLLTLVFAALIWFIFRTGPAVYRYLALYRHYRLMEKVELVRLPLTGHERIQPFNSIATLINQEALSETEDATRPRFVRKPDGTYTYTSCLGPSKGYRIQQFSKNMYQMLEVPAALPSPNFSARYREEVDFPTGEFLLFSKNVETATCKRFGFFKYMNYEPADVIFLRNDEGNWVQVVSLIRWKGFLFPRPVFGGVMIHEQKGKGPGFVGRLFAGYGTYLSPGEITQIKFLSGQNLIPERVARFAAESFRFRNGFFAPMPYYHEGDIRIPDLPRDQSPQPFVVYAEISENSEGKIYSYFGLEPYQEQKKGLSLSLFIPGDGEDKVYFMDHDKRQDAYIGSSAIPAKIVESKKNYDWSENYPAEARPFVREINGKRRFFWLSTVVTRAGADGKAFIGGSIPEITLTDANYGRVIWISQDSISETRHWARAVQKEMQIIWQKE